MVHNRRVLVSFTCGFVAALLLIGALADTLSASWARSQNVVESHEVTPGFIAAAPTSPPKPVSSAFDQCAITFFSPTLPTSIENSGLHFTPTHFYAWFVNVVQRVVPTENADVALASKIARPYFTDKGWEEFTIFVSQNVTPFLSTTKDGLVVSRLMSAPRVVEATSVTTAGKRIGSKVVFDVDYSLRYVARAVHPKNIKSSESFPRLVITTVNLDETHRLQIDGWQGKNITEK